MCPGEAAETLPELLAKLAGSSPSAPALHFGARTVTFGELEARAAALAGGLQARGIGRGDRVALWLPNCPEWLELHFALARLGALTVAVNTRFRAHEVEDVLVRSEAAAVAIAPGFKDIDFEGILAGIDAPALRLRVGGEEYEELAAGAPAADRAEPGAACVVFTSSGTTGRPKLVVHSQRGVAAHAQAVADGFGYREPGTVALGMLPLCGVFGYDSVLGALAGGAAVVQQAVFDGEEAAGLAARHGATHANGSDGMVLRLLAAGPPPSLRTIGFAAFDGPARRVIDAADALGITAYMCYGSTEVQALLAHAPADGTPERRALAGGVPVSPETTVRAGEDGELEVRGPSVMAGYLDDDAAPAFTPDWFVRTGDVGELTDDGFVFASRRGDVLRLGGFLVNPQEIEDFLLEDDAIAAASVVAAEADGALRAVAFVVGEADERETIERCRTQLASYKVPRRVLVLDELPTTDGPNGRKVQRAELRRHAAEALQESNGRSTHAGTHA
jgi:fatty-acyl-CoA synthase